MYYSSVIDYLKEQAYQPYLDAVKNNDYDRAQAILEWLMWKYIEQVAEMNAYEKILTDNNIDMTESFKDWEKYRNTFLQPYYEQLKDGWEDETK